MHRDDWGLCVGNMSDDDEREAVYEKRMCETMDFWVQGNGWRCWPCTLELQSARLEVSTYLEKLRRKLVGMTEPKKGCAVEELATCLKDALHKEGVVIGRLNIWTISKDLKTMEKTVCDVGPKDGGTETVVWSGWRDDYHCVRIVMPVKMGLNHIWYNLLPLVGGLISAHECRLRGDAVQTQPPGSCLDVFVARAGGGDLSGLCDMLASSENEDADSVHVRWGVAVKRCGSGWSISRRQIRGTHDISVYGWDVMQNERMVAMIPEIAAGTLPVPRYLKDAAEKFTQTPCYGAPTRWLESEMYDRLVEMVCV